MYRHLWINSGETLTGNTGDVFMPSLVLFIQWGVIFHIALGMKERKRQRRKEMEWEGGEGKSDQCGWSNRKAASWLAYLSGYSEWSRSDHGHISLTWGSLRLLQKPEAPAAKQPCIRWLQDHLPRRGWFGWKLLRFTIIPSKELEGGVNHSPDIFHRRELPGPACFATAMRCMGQQRHQRLAPQRAHRNTDEMACGNSAPPMEPRTDACGWKHLYLWWMRRR